MAELPLLRNVPDATTESTNRARPSKGKYGSVSNVQVDDAVDCVWVKYAGLNTSFVTPWNAFAVKSTVRILLNSRSANVVSTFSTRSM